MRSGVGVANAAKPFLLAPSVSPLTLRERGYTVPARITATSLSVLFVPLSALVSSRWSGKGPEEVGAAVSTPGFCITWLFPTHVPITQHLKVGHAPVWEDLVQNARVLGRRLGTEVTNIVISICS